jgi:tRNA(fMet)-specific endonuclease VapC
MVKMKLIAIDTNIAVEILNNQKTTIDKISKYDVLCLPIIVCGELLYGAKNSSRKRDNEKKFNSFIQSCVILNSNSLVAEEYAEIRKGLKDKGKPIPENDIWIAAICKVNEIPLVTRDKHFKNIANLKIAKI